MALVSNSIDASNRSDNSQRTNIDKSNRSVNTNIDQSVRQNTQLTTNTSSDNNSVQDASVRGAGNTLSFVNSSNNRNITQSGNWTLKSLFGGNEQKAGVQVDGGKQSSANSASTRADQKQSGGGISMMMIVFILILCVVLFFIYRKFTATKVGASDDYDYDLI